MKSSDPDNQLALMVADLEEDAVLELVQKRIDAGDDPLQIINECNKGMRVVGQRYEKGDYFIAGLIMSGEIFREVVELVHPLLEKQVDGDSSGRVLVGTVAGDIHDLGKNMLGMLLACHGFEVIDLGVDVPPDEFAAKVVETKPDFVGLSGLITASYEKMKETVSMLRKEAKKHKLSFPIIIGGGFIDDQICEYVEADYWMPDAMSGVRLCEELSDKKADS
ncbi:MAG: cobalamin-dependent protein [Anaerolineales bacterium]|jgi:methylmalonyl-CoA mutase cobalamin-binding domain/chain